MFPVSVVIPWRDRPELGRACELNAPYFNSIGAEVLIVNSGGQASVLRGLVPASQCDCLRVLTLPTTGSFCKSECLNVGAVFSRSDALFLLDADIILNSGFLEKALVTLAKRQCFISVGSVVETNPTYAPEDSWNRESFISERAFTRELRSEDGRVASVRYWMSKYGSRSGSGLMVMRKEHLLAVEGFNSELREWGFEEYDFQIRLQFALGLESVVEGEGLLHISHDRVGNIAESHARNEAMCRRRHDRGQLNGTLIQDVARWRGGAIEELL